jgi:hypothetical protein
VSIPVADDLLGRLTSSPDVYPQSIDLARAVVLLVLLDEDAYRTASFLDDRILAPGMKGAWFGLDRVDEASRLIDNPQPVHFIFHTGHVGSTLLTRLLDETRAVLSLREPLPLRILADAHDALAGPGSALTGERFDRILAMLIRLWARGYPETRSVVLKATSSCGRLAEALLEASKPSRAVYMNLRAEPYLATLLAGENSPTDLRGHGPERMRRLQSHLTEQLPPLQSLSLGELAAMSWLVESWAQHEAVSRFADRVIPLDFDRLLADVPGTLGPILAHFGLPHDAPVLSELARSPALSRYSKAPEYEYSASLRSEILRGARRDHREEIMKGIAWLEQRARSATAVARLLAA